jgi:hypothetical protein
VNTARGLALTPSTADTIRMNAWSNVCPAPDLVDKPSNVVNPGSPLIAWTLGPIC